MSASVRDRSGVAAVLVAVALLCTIAAVASPARAARDPQLAPPEAYTTLSLINGWSGGGQRSCGLGASQRRGWDSNPRYP